MMDEKDIKRLLKESKVKASNSFTDRVMHQIRTEESLRPKKVKEAPTMKTTFSIFGVMFGIFILVGLYFYIGENQNLLDSDLFLKIVLLVSGVSAVFYLITVFDDYKLLKNK